MKWYAIRTKPGAQQPKREYWLEPSASALAGETRGKGYSLASSTNPEISAVELALQHNGVTYYMPAEFKAVRNRHHKNLYELRRFALLKGYMFVGDPDWSKVIGAAGVHSIVTNAGEPFCVSPMDLFRLRMFEQNNRAVAAAQAKAMTTAEDRKERQKRKDIIRAARKKLFPGREVKLAWGEKTGREATVQAWQDQDQVRVLLRSLEASEETLVVPYEFLKAG